MLLHTFFFLKTKNRCFLQLCNTSAHHAPINSSATAPSPWPVTFRLTTPGSPSPSSAVAASPRSTRPSLRPLSAFPPRSCRDPASQPPHRSAAFLRRRRSSAALPPPSCLKSRAADHRSGAKRTAMWRGAGKTSR